MDLQPVQEEYEAVKARADALVGKYNLPDLAETMKNRAAATDSESEEVNEAWLDGKVTAEEFLERYRKLRESYHRTSSRRPSWSRTCRGGRRERGAKSATPAAAAAADARVRTPEVLSGGDGPNRIRGCAFWKKNDSARGARSVRTP